MSLNLSYSQAIQFLYELQLFGAKLGLENTHHLAALAGNPHHQLQFVHVAGTNGKGSTCAFLESIYRSAGLRVGLFTSPHLISFAERIQINRRWISHDDVSRWVAQLQKWLQAFPKDQHPTFFEVVTVMALSYFAEQHCDLVIWETGLGGRLDATNIVSPIASVITNIDFDHEKWLGQSLAEIASEKAGIIKPGVPLITAEQKPEPLQTIQLHAQHLHAPLFHVTSEDLHQPLLDGIQLPLAGEHQRWNAALALKTVSVAPIQVNPSSIRDGLLHAHWPGRLQIVRPHPGRVIVLDGAHNPAGAKALRTTIEKEFPSSLPTFVMGVMRDKNWKAISQILSPLASRFLLVPVSSERSADPTLLRDSVSQANPSAEVRSFEALSHALAASANDPLVIITGSLHLIGEAMEQLNLVPSPISDERALNNWQSPRK